jgi:hypothetical protein
MMEVNIGIGKGYDIEGMINQQLYMLMVIKSIGRMGNGFIIIGRVDKVKEWNGKI